MRTVPGANRVVWTPDRASMRRVRRNKCFRGIDGDATISLAVANIFFTAASGSCIAPTDLLDAFKRFQRLLATRLWLSLGFGIEINDRVSRRPGGYHRHRGQNCKDRGNRHSRCLARCHLSTTSTMLNARNRMTISTWRRSYR